MTELSDGRGYVVTVFDQCILSNVGMVDYMSVDSGLAAWSGKFQVSGNAELHLIVQFWSLTGCFQAPFSVLYRVISKRVYLHNYVALLPFVLPINIQISWI